ncbi:MAG: methyltransferase [Rhodospirillales bacterium]|nr:methyltransferase [Rhodospirillales bacterium]
MDRPPEALHDAVDFIRTRTIIAAPSLVPELRLHLATEVTPLWQATEASLTRDDLQPPYWAFAWPGGQALARYAFDHPAAIRGRRVLDFAAGCGVAGIAAAKVGAASVLAADIDAFAATALALNARLNGATIEVTTDDLTAVEGAGWDIVLAGDVCYERPMAERVLPWLRRIVAAGATVLLGDPGRSYLPSEGIEEIARYTVPTSRDLEDCTARETRVLRLAGQATLPVLSDSSAARTIR